MFCISPYARHPGHCLFGSTYTSTRTRGLRYSQPPARLAGCVRTKVCIPRLPSLSLYLNCPVSMSRSSKLFGVAKRCFTQCLWKGHVHRSNIIFQCDSHYRCCACTAAVLKRYGLVVQYSPTPRGELPRHGGGGITRGAWGTYLGCSLRCVKASVPLPLDSMPCFAGGSSDCLFFGG